MCGIGIDAQIGDDEICICIIRHRVRGAAVCDEVVAHHVERRLGRIGADALRGNAVIGAGDDDTRLRRCGMPLARDADIADEGVRETSKIDAVMGEEGFFDPFGNRRIGNLDVPNGTF